MTETELISVVRKALFELRADITDFLVGLPETADSLPKMDLWETVYQSIADTDILLSDLKAETK